MQKRVNEIFNHIVNKGLIMNKLKNDLKAVEMMIDAGVPSTVIQRVLSNAQKIRSSDWH